MYKYRHANLNLSVFPGGRHKYRQALFIRYKYSNANLNLSVFPRVGQAGIGLQVEVLLSA